MSFTLYILVIPIALFLLLGLTGHKMKPRIAGIIGTSGMAVSAVLSYITAFLYFFQKGKIDDVFQKIVPISMEWLRFSDNRWLCACSIDWDYINKDDE
jgi:NADH-quinone oxidoreductase subunit L